MILKKSAHDKKVYKNSRRQRVEGLDIFLLVIAGCKPDRVAQ